MRVLLQAGHYPSAGGAPGEAAWTYDLAQRIAARLQERSVTVVIVGAWALDNSNPPPQVRQDWDLFVSLHYDADIYPVRTGCFAGRAALDEVGAASDRAIVCWKAVYPKATGIPLHEERMNPNVTDYYAFRATTARTPGILIEHGVGQGLDHAVLFERIDIVADADASAILAYLGVGANDVTPEQQRILDAAARHGLDDAGIDQLVGVNTDLGRQVNSLQWLLHTSQQETADRDALIVQLQQQAPTAETVERVEVQLSGGRVQVLSR